MTRLQHMASQTRYLASAFFAEAARGLVVTTAFFALCWLADRIAGA